MTEEAQGKVRRFKLWINRLLNPGDDDSHLVDNFIILLIAANVLAVIFQTEPTLETEYKGFFYNFELISTIIFTMEYVCRMWVCTLDKRYQGGIKGRLRYAITPMALVDIIAIAPFYLQFIKMDLRIARAIRLMRLVRILKMGRYAHAVKTLTNVIARKKEELTMVTFMGVMVLVLCASLIYFTEHGALNDKGEAIGNFSSIPESMWWAVVTLTSVGFGDVVPSTGVGQFVGAIICVLGVMMVALPTGILASGFAEEIREQRRGKDSDIFGFCPHCGEQLIPGEELE